MTEDESLYQIVSEAAVRDDVCDAVENIYRQAQVAIDLRRPRCSVSGRCCHFDDFGHRLYVTALELAVLVSRLRGNRLGAPKSLLPEVWDRHGCPFQAERLCRIHVIRPFGCRIFFCDPAARQWQEDQYALFHESLKALHVALGVPYRYVEWRAGLEAVGSGGSAI